MNVKRVYNSLKNQNIRSLYFFAALLFFLLGIGFFQLPNREMRAKKTELALRLIGHKLLQKSGDSTTVLSSIQIEGDQHLSIHLADQKTLDPDHLVELSLNHLKTDLAGSYIVNVVDLNLNQTVYGFAIDHFEQKEISCLGRVLPVSKYAIEFSFYDQHLIPISKNVPAIGLASASFLLLFIGLAGRKESEQESNTNALLRGYRIDTARNRLYFCNDFIELTTKEVKILSILFEHVDQLVERDHLLHEVWVKEGTLTSRSLDMYISRLRKKLTQFSHLEIVNQRGRGYYLRNN